MKSELTIEQSLNCSSQVDIQKIAIQGATLTIVDDTTDLVELLDEKDYCQWFFCRMNPECGQSSSESNYLYMKDKVDCSEVLNDLSCVKCNILE